MTNNLRWVLFGAAGVVSLTLAEKVFTSPASQAVATAPGSSVLSCDMEQYKAATGLTAAMQGGVLTVQWTGQ